MLKQALSKIDPALLTGGEALNQGEGVLCGLPSSRSEIRPSR